VARCAIVSDQAELAPLARGRTSPTGTAGLVAEHGALLLAQVVALGIVARDALGIEGFPLDDAWIHQVVARTFAQTGTLGYEAGRFGSAATSYLWAALLAVNFRFVHLSPVLYTTLLAGSCHVASGQILLACLRRDGLSRVARMWAAALFACAANYVWFALSGMEVSLFAALALLAIFAWDAGGAQSRPIVAGLASGAVAWTRPEAMLLAPLLLATTPGLRAALRRRRSVIALVAPWLGSVAAYFLVNRVFAGHWVPLTLRGRSWMWLEPLEGASRVLLGGQLFMAWQDRIAEFTLGSPLAFWCALGAAAIGVADVVRGSAPRLRALLAFGALHLAVFAVLLPVQGHGGRYQPLTPALFMAMAALGLVGIGRSLSGRRAWIVAALPIPLALLTVGALERWRVDHALAVTHVQRTEVSMGKLIATLPPDANVASFDIGGIGFFADRPLRDLGALVDPSLVPVLQHGEAAKWLLDSGATHVVLPMSYSDDSPDPWNFGVRLMLLDDPRLMLVPLAERKSPPSLWLPGLRATLHCSPRQVLYRVLAHEPAREGGRP
jgi:hypothetical protein